MPTRTTLTIPTPCHENWAAMTPAAQGRHCAACNKVVIDFSQKIDAEILALLRQVSQPCGRLTPSQLNRPLTLPPAPAPRWPTWLAATAAVLGLREISAVPGQAQYAAPTEQRVITMGIVAVPNRVEPFSVWAPAGVVRGIVRDSTTQEPLPGVTVLVKGTTLGVSTNEDGTFELEIPAPAAGKTLVFSSVGFVTQERILGSDPAPEMFIELRLSGHVLGELIVTGYAVQKPWPWHPRGRVVPADATISALAVNLSAPKILIAGYEEFAARYTIPSFCHYWLLLKAYQ